MDHPEYEATISILTEVLDEVEKAEAKHGPQMDLPLGFSSLRFAQKAAEYTGLTNQAAAVGQCTWMHIAREEVFETFAEDDPAKARAEALQAAAMFIQIIRKIDHDAEQAMVEQVLADPTV